MEILPKVSVIIPTRNSEKTLGLCLLSVRKQNYLPESIELFVVDNFSSDSTTNIAKRFNCEVFSHGPERSAQRNFGIKIATGKYVLYLDSDMSLTENVIKECVEKCENEGNIALYIPEHLVGEGFWIKVRAFERDFYNATCIDCVRFVRRDKLLEIGGFDDNLTGPEDWDLDRRIRAIGKVESINSHLYHNVHAEKIWQYFEKKQYYANSFARYIKKWGENDPIIKKQLGAKYRLWGVFVENGKWKELLKHPLLSIGMYVIRFLVGMNYLREIVLLQRSKNIKL